jgi:tetratricopeptide (TPR) repeat protein
LLGLSLAAVLGAAWLAFSSSDLAQWRFLTAPEEGYRLNVWKTALRLWQTDPIAGAGAGTFANGARQLRLQSEAHDDVCAHNDWVQGLAELGLIGTGLGFCIGILHFAAGWGAFGGELRRRGPARNGNRVAAIQAGALASLGACVVHSFFDFNMQVPANMLLLAFVLGLLAAPGVDTGKGSFRILAGKSALVFTAALGVALAFMVWKCHRAELNWILANNALRDGEPELALELARKGLQENPAHARLNDTAGRASFTLAGEAEANADQRSRHSGDAVDFFQKTALLEPEDAWNFLNLAHAFDTRGPNSISKPLCLQAISKAPFYSAPYESLGLVLETSKQPMEAIRIYGLACALPGATYSPQRREALKNAFPEE